MPKERFTPGPWKVGNYTDFIEISRDSPDEIKEVCYIDDWADEQEAAANATLIAQSPSLYANEEISCYVMSQALDFIQRRLTKQDNLLIIEMLKRQIETTEQLLAKCRGEVKDE